MLLCRHHDILLCAAVQIGRTLVFENLQQAASYREYVCQTLRGNCADLVTLCGNKLSGRGVVLGSGFRVLPIEQAPCRFGTIPKGQQVREHTQHDLQSIGRFNRSLCTASRSVAWLPGVWCLHNWCAV
jgi:hypothetical protein